jgi:hypothetical protein
MRKWLRSIRGEHVAITGRVWLPRHEVQRLVWRARGIPTPRGDVTAATTVLVRGDSSRWAFGEFGSKEKDAARLLSKGAAVSSFTIPNFAASWKTESQLGSPTASRESLSSGWRRRRSHNSSE